jgi:hypothetical protein
MTNDQKSVLVLLGIMSGIVALVLVVCSVFSYGISGVGERGCSVLIAIVLLFVADDWIRLGE